MAGHNSGAPSRNNLDIGNKIRKEGCVFNILVLWTGNKSSNTKLEYAAEFATLTASLLRVMTLGREKVINLSCPADWDREF